MHVRWIVLGLALTFVCDSHAWAQVRAAALSRMQMLNKKAMDEYDSLEFEAAKAALVEALSVAKEARIARGRTLADTYLNLGIVFGAGFNDQNNALDYFTAALRSSPSAKLNPTRATPALEEIFKVAQERAKQLPQQSTAPVFFHNPVDEATRGRRVKIYARVSRSLQVSRILLYFRPSGTMTFNQVEMKHTRPGLYLGFIPGEEVEGRSIHYYLEALDSAGSRINGHGSVSSPNIISVKEPDTAIVDDEEIRKPKPKPTGQSFSIGILMGAGVGFVFSGKSEHAQQQTGGLDTALVDIETGGALAPFHVAPELSYHLSDTWHLSVIGRIQVVNAVDVASKISVLGEARIKRFYGTGGLRFYWALGAGGGQVRYRINLGDYDKQPDTPNDIADTRVGGIGAFGLGAGLVYMFSDHVGYGLDLNGFILVPDYAANLDINTGLLISF